MTTPTPGAAGTTPAHDNRECLFLALAELHEASSVHLAALGALNAARDHIEAVLMRTAGAVEGGAA